jgi:hypothetical protein
LAIGASADDIVEVVAYSTFEVLNQTFSGDTAVTGNFTVDGNVGIGTSSPATGTHLQRASGNTYYRAQNNLANVDFGVDGAGTGILWNNSNYPLTFGTNNTERMRIDYAGRVTKPYQPMFEVTDGSIAGNGDIYWTTIRANVGSHYNSSNGRFTAPVNGYYVFHATGGNSTTYGFDIMKNSGTYRRNEMVNPAGFRWTTVSTVMYLAAGDYVNCWLFTGSIAVNSPYAGFSGYLLG